MGLREQECVVDDTGGVDDGVDAAEAGTHLGHRLADRLGVGHVAGEQQHLGAAGLELPDGYGIVIGGEAEAIRDNNRQLTIVALLAVFLVFVVMAVQYESLVNPFVILLAIPLSLVGVGLLIWATGTPLSAPVLLGVILLAGVFQFSSLKEKCLQECRHPGVFLMRRYRRGAAPALRIGVAHGLFCLGCCWALMLLMFAAGNDTIVSTRAVEDFAVRAKVSSCILMPGSKHEILQENDAVRTRFWAAFDAYLGVEMKVA